jgi:hypothetical protein
VAQYAWTLWPPAVAAANRLRWAIEGLFALLIALVPRKAWHKPKAAGPVASGPTGPVVDALVGVAEWVGVAV